MHICVQDNQIYSKSQVCQSNSLKIRHLFVILNVVLDSRFIMTCHKTRVDKIFRSSLNMNNMVLEFSQ